MKAFSKQKFGEYDNKDVFVYTFETDSGYQMSVMPYGATLLEYCVLDKHEQLQNITLRFGEFKHYIQNIPKLGASIGPVAGRIANGSFTLNGQTYQLPKNNGNHHLHGGETGYADTLFEVEAISDYAITFYTKRTDQTGNYPGNVDTWITYSLNEQGKLSIDYRITTDQDTLINPTNHTYFNLSGSDMDVIDDTIMTINSTHYLETTDDLIPTGTLLDDEPFFKKIQKGTRLSDVFSMINGLDTSFILGDGTKAVELYLEKTGIHLTVETQSPAVVVYTANSYLPNENLINGKLPVQHNGIAIETQYLPDAIHHDKFGSIVLKAGEYFESRTVFYARVQ